jgi:hypothetical protein
VHLAYLVFIYPIQSLLSLAFGLYVSMTGNYGASLILLSLTVTGLTAPLYYLAERWKLAEDEAKARMDRDVSSIKKNYTGQKRFYLIRNARRIHGYRTSMAIKASFGLFVQIPFFLAAYEFLSSFAGYRGVPFLLIPDLGKPDGILGGLNVLPLAMTTINLISAAIYNRSRPLKESVPLVAMATAFLALLYGKPAALLVYWTSNNVLSLLKNLFFPAKRIDGAASASPGLAEVIRLLKPALPAACFAAAVSAQAWWLIARDRSYEICLVITALIAVMTSMWSMIRVLRSNPLDRSLRRLAPLAFSWGLFAVSAWFVVFARRQNAYISNPNIKLLTTLLADVAGLIAASIALSGNKVAAGVSAPRPKAAGDHLDAAAFVCSVIFVSSYLWVLSPLQFYFSSPADVGMSLASLFWGNLARAAVTSALLAGIGLVLARGRLAALSVVGVSVCVCLAAFALITGGRYGVLDEFALDRAALLDRPSPLMMLDIPVVAGAVLLASWLARARRRLMVPLVCALFAVMAAQVGLAAAKADASSFAETIVPDGEDLPDDAFSVNRFTKTGRNVVYIIPDMLNGNYVGDLVSERPELADRLAGFVWFPNAVSAGSHTALSLPAMYGGVDFEPIRLKSLPGTGLDKLNRAADRLFGGVADLGFAVSAADPMYSSAPASIPGSVVTKSSDYAAYWTRRDGRKTGLDSAGAKRPLLTLLALFRSAPFSLKRALYDNGSWVVFRKSFQFDYIERKTIRNYGYLDLLPELSSTTAKGDSFIFLHTQFTHEPYGVDAEGKVVSGGYPDPETKSFVDARGARLSGAKFLDFLARWTEWMRQAGVYDNTLIIVVADHGNNYRDHGITFEGSLDNPVDQVFLSRVRPAFLVKPFRSNGPFSADDRLLSNADAPAIIFHALGAGSGWGPDPLSGNGRIETRFSYLSGSWKEFLGGERAQTEDYRARGDGRAGKNWSRE